MDRLARHYVDADYQADRAMAVAWIEVDGWHQFGFSPT
jgi:hypothetical protein